MKSTKNPRDGNTQTSHSVYYFFSPSTKSLHNNPTLPQHQTFWGNKMKSTNNPPDERTQIFHSVRYLYNVDRKVGHKQIFSIIYKAVGNWLRIELNNSTHNIMLQVCHILNRISFLLSRYIFYRVVCTTAFACIAIDLLLHLLSQWKKLPEAFKSTKFLLGATLTASVSFLATASLLLDVADVSINERDALVASFCGFLATIAFLLESFLYFLKIRSENLYRVD